MFIPMFANIKLYKHFLMFGYHRRYGQLRTKFFFPREPLTKKNGESTGACVYIVLLYNYIFFS